MGKYDTYTSMSCTPCNKSDWKLLQALKTGWTPTVSKGNLTADSSYFDYIREYKEEKDVPCCGDNEKTT